MILNTLIHINSHDKISKIIYTPLLFVSGKIYITPTLYNIYIHEDEDINKRKYI